LHRPSGPLLLLLRSRPPLRRGRPSKARGTVCAAIGTSCGRRLRSFGISETCVALLPARTPVWRYYFWAGARMLFLTRESKCILWHTRSSREIPVQTNEDRSPPVTSRRALHNAFCPFLCSTREVAPGVAMWNGGAAARLCDIRGRRKHYATGGHADYQHVLVSEWTGGNGLQRRARGDGRHNSV